MKLFHKLYARQFRRPSGLLGHIAAGFMRKNNLDYYARAIDLLHIQDQDTILEVGCGEALATKLIIEQYPDCHVDGIDFSNLMLKKAARNVSAAILDKRVQLRCGNILDYNFGQSTYSKIFAINVIYFWETLAAPFAKLHALLKPQGRLVLFMSSPERLRQIPFAIDSVFNKYTAVYVQAELTRAGFDEVTCQTVVRQGQDTYYICADKTK